MCVCVHVFLFSCEGMNESSWRGPTLRGRLIWPGVFGLCQSARFRWSCSHNWPLCSKMSLLSKKQKESRRCLSPSPFCFSPPCRRSRRASGLNGRPASRPIGGVSARVLKLFNLQCSIIFHFLPFVKVLLAPLYKKQ